MKQLYPDEYVSSIYKINFKRLWQKGYKGLMFDLDNTLAPYDREHPDEELIRLFDTLKKIGFKIALVSNNNAQRVHKFNTRLNVDAFPRANKPLTRQLRIAIRNLNIESKQTVFIGDQLFTDVWVGKRLKCRTILVKPIQDKEQWVSRIKRGLETKILRQYMRHRKKKSS
ncbi:YqeG family HAD IIIA-type phosphatase [Vallitaleaceae bacterium 9-2]